MLLQSPRDPQMRRFIALSYRCKEFALRLESCPTTVECLVSSVGRKQRLSSYDEPTRRSSDRRLA